VTRSCYECSHFEPGDVDPEMGRIGKCALARKKYGGEVTVAWSAPSCKGFVKEGAIPDARRRR
jgi:hypothetical protein